MSASIDDRLIDRTVAGDVWINPEARSTRPIPSNLVLSVSLIGKIPLELV